MRTWQNRSHCTHPLWGRMARRSAQLAIAGLCSTGGVLPRLHAQEASPRQPTSYRRLRKDSTRAASPGFWTVVRAPNAPDLDKLGGSVHRVSVAELRALEYADPNRAMARIPGVYVRSEDGFGLRPNIDMRGANSHRSRRIAIRSERSVAIGASEIDRAASAMASVSPDSGVAARSSVRCSERTSESQSAAHRSASDAARLGVADPKSAPFLWSIGMRP